MDDDRLRWDLRYQQAIDDGASGTPDVAPSAPEMLAWFPDLAERLPVTGRAVDIACGPGKVTLWLAARGLSVVGLDVSPVAVDLLRTASNAIDVGDVVDARVVDLDSGLPDDLDDLDLVVCQRFRDPALYPAMIDRLSPGGTALVTVLSAVGSDAAGPFHAPAGELLTAFTNDACEVTHHRERDGLASIVVRRR